MYHRLAIISASAFTYAIYGSNLNGFSEMSAPSFTQKLQDGDNGVRLCWAHSDFDFPPLSTIQINNKHANPWNWSYVTSGVLLLSEAILISERHVSVHSITEYVISRGGRKNKYDADTASLCSGEFRAAVMRMKMSPFQAATTSVHAYSEKVHSWTVSYWCKLFLSGVNYSRMKESDVCLVFFSSSSSSCKYLPLKQK